MSAKNAKLLRQAVRVPLTRGSRNDGTLEVATLNTAAVKRALSAGGPRQRRLLRELRRHVKAGQG